MKKTLFFYNIIFLFFGNILLSNIHNMYEHDDSTDYHECEECLIFESNNSYILDFNEFIFSNYTTNILAFPDLDFNNSDFNLKNGSRAPPISQ